MRHFKTVVLLSVDFIVSYQHRLNILAKIFDISDSLFPVVLNCSATLPFIIPIFYSRC